jgi:deoxyadenosine/deoxycytidine kinase
MTRPVRIVIDGNIGSGKTTQLALLEKKGWTVRREPIESWPLDKFYEDPKRWAFYFHMVILQTLRPIKTAEPVFYERSLLSSRWVFWPVLQKKGYVTPEEDKTYSQFYEQYAWYPDLYIYLSKDLDLAWEHIQKRGQAGDGGVTREYLEELDQEYRNMVRSVPCRVRVINANASIEEIHNQICSIIEDNELFVCDGHGLQMQKEGRPGRKVSCTPFQNLCRLS